MRYLKAFGTAVFVLTLVACPVAAYWGASRGVWYLTGLVLIFAVFYFSCALLMRSQVVAGALIGILLAIPFTAPRVDGHSDAKEHLGAFVILTVCGAFLGWAVDSAMKHQPPKSGDGFA